uniref:Proline-rich protein 36-like isoform X1 n=1 Tax=Geotrypetes seraphini TaxID=260995 RepID=A0A6P8QAU7_GEOSA|nr:proline-rich protein 36-like isoform X1 [Geotrypetes seraphini]
MQLHQHFQKHPHLSPSIPAHLLSSINSPCLLPSSLCHISHLSTFHHIPHLFLFPSAHLASPSPISPHSLPIPPSITLISPYLLLSTFHHIPHLFLFPSAHLVSPSPISPHSLPIPPSITLISTYVFLSTFITFLISSCFLLPTLCHLPPSLPILFLFHHLSHSSSLPVSFCPLVSPSSISPHSLPILPSITLISPYLLLSTFHHPSSLPASFCPPCVTFPHLSPFSSYSTIYHTHLYICPPVHLPSHPSSLPVSSCPPSITSLISSCPPCVTSSISLPSSLALPPITLFSLSLPAQTPMTTPSSLTGYSCHSLISSYVPFSPFLPHPSSLPLLSSASPPPILC